MVQPCLGGVAGSWTRVGPRGVLQLSGDAEVPWEAVCSCCGSVLLPGCTPEADWIACEWSLGTFAAAWPLLALSGGSAAAPALLRTSMCTSKSLRKGLRQSHAAEDAWEAGRNMPAVPATNEMARQRGEGAVKSPLNGARGVGPLPRQGSQAGSRCEDPPALPRADASATGGALLHGAFSAQGKHANLLDVCR